VWKLFLYSDGYSEYSKPFNNIDRIQFNKDFTGLVLLYSVTKPKLSINWSYDKKNNKLIINILADTIEGILGNIPNEFTVLKLTNNDLWLFGKKKDGCNVVYKFRKDNGWTDARGMLW
jgi:hypothetical protein